MSSYLFILLIALKAVDGRPNEPETTTTNRLESMSSTSPTDENESGNWGYTNENGPDKWPNTCHYGKRQSPINIDTSNIIPTEVNQLHFVNYGHTFENITGENIGRGVVFTGFSNRKEVAPFVYGGELKGKYLLYQFHFHWSRHFLNGSEHTIDHKHYPVEIHLVHIREDLTLTEAYNATDGVAVLAVFCQIEKNGSALEHLSHYFERLVHQGEMVFLNFSPDYLLPSNTKNFYHYEGSLTTPGCFETVDWMVFHQPLAITNDQVRNLRQIEIIGRSDADTRPTQPINDRKVSDCLAVLKN